MTKLLDYLMKHEHGGDPIVQVYSELERNVTNYRQIVEEMNSLKGTGDWVMKVPVEGYDYGVTIIDGDEPFIGPFGNAMMEEVRKIQGNIRYLTRTGWGLIPLVQEHFEKFMEMPFPTDYQGYDVPPELDKAGLIAE